MFHLKPFDQYQEEVQEKSQEELSPQEHIARQEHCKNEYASLVKETLEDMYGSGDEEEDEEDEERLRQELARVIKEKRDREWDVKHGWKIMHASNENETRVPKLTEEEKVQIQAIVKEVESKEVIETMVPKLTEEEKVQIQAIVREVIVIDDDSESEEEREVVVLDSDMDSEDEKEVVVVDSDMDSDEEEEEDENKLVLYSDIVDSEDEVIAMAKSRSRSKRMRMGAWRGRERDRKKKSLCVCVVDGYKKYVAKTDRYSKWAMVIRNVLPKPTVTVKGRWL